MEIVKLEIGSSVENLEHQILEQETTSGIDGEVGMKLQGLLQSIEDLYQMLEDFNLALRGRVMSVIRRKATPILQKSDQVIFFIFKVGSLI
jgi:hypothetical protein